MYLSIHLISECKSYCILHLALKVLLFNIFYFYLFFYYLFSILLELEEKVRPT